jgi:lysophospholipase L1-like esterase
MKTVLCFGDSNTWGAKPMTSIDVIERFDRDERWPGVLGRVLGKEYEIIAEGLNGRTTVWEDPIEGYKKGSDYLIPCLDTHQPLDLVIIMLGTNDLKVRHSVTPQDIALSAGVLVGMVQRHPVQVAGGNIPKVLLIAPPPMHPDPPDFIAEMFAGGYQKSLNFAKHFSRVANAYDCAFLDAREVISSSPVDGIHLGRGEHEKLGQAVVEITKKLLI